MDKIKVMSETLANKIAAGEVIEKCASIVKELVENSIDAKATSVRVDLVDSGLKSISVIDDGVGMSKNDALLCFQRHATSKLLKDNDLFFIDTLGFRGEALPSIASVSEVNLYTSYGEVGSYIHIKGGELLEESPSPLRKGTKITVSNLFYNTPARLKYLKSEQSELANIVLFIERLALSKPNIKFVLTNNGRSLVKTSGSGKLDKTIHEVFGLSISSNLIKVESNNDDYDISGYVVKPSVLKSNRNMMITIVNGRVVRNYELNKAINDAYYTYKPEGKYPVVILQIETDPTLIDVNIHPTKQDIKLSKINELSEIVVKMIKGALYQTILIPNVSVSIDREEETVEVSNEYEVVQESFEFSIQEDNVITENDIEKVSELKLYPVGLGLGTYIVAQNEEGLYLVDQHAAQERIHYEMYLQKLKDKNLEVIETLFPISIELIPSEYLIVKEHLDDLLSKGFGIEEFGINTFLIKSHPTWLRQGYEEESIKRIFDVIVTTHNEFDVVKFNEAAAIMLSCKMSIKANMSISMIEMENLLNDLVLCDNPYNCPHGRPTIVKFSLYDLEKMFKRVMN